MIICKDLDATKTIKDINHWHDEFFPDKRDDKGNVIKSDFHWQKGRSAMTLAENWLWGGGKEVLDMLQKSDAFNGVLFDIASPEYESRFDKYGNGRIHDLLALGHRNDEKVIVAVEGKVDERFGNDTLGSYYNKGVLKRLSGVSTKVPNRIEDLIRALFIPPYGMEIMELQYQLVHAIAGTLAEAGKQGIKKAAFIVETFETDKFDIYKYKDNQIKLDMLIEILSDGKVTAMKEQEIYGPYVFAGNEYIPSDVELYVGKLMVDWK